MALYNILYSVLLIPLLRLLIGVLKPFVKKIRVREDNIGSSLTALDKLQDQSGRKRLWVHAASMGEFEQAKPVIELIKEKYPDVLIICSFFSPSGYNNQKKYKYADAVVYLPLDSRKNAESFINKVKPDAAVFVRYEIWRNYFMVLRRKGIPLLLICATVPGSRVIRTLPTLKNFYISIYNLFTGIYTVGKPHTDFFINAGVKCKVKTLTDTRFDRIIKNVETAEDNPVLPKEIFGNNFVLVAGSTWPEDEDLILYGLNQMKDNDSISLILVPHEPTAEHIESLKKKANRIVLLSSLIELIDKNAGIVALGEAVKDKIIVVDSIGKLLRLYSAADAAYIGGAFGAGVHSVTEPAGYGIPLSSGPKMNNSPDAGELSRTGALTVLNKPEDFAEWLSRLVKDEKYRIKAGKAARDYVYSSRGSSEIIARDILNILK